jgi:hypothetical protein
VNIDRKRYFNVALPISTVPLLRSRTTFTVPVYSGDPE